MNKIRALLAAVILLAGLASCAGSADETDDTTNALDTEGQETLQDETDEETESKVSRPDEVEVVYYHSLTLETENADRFFNGENAAYDAENNALVFVTTERIDYKLDDACSVGVAGEDDGYTVDGKLVTENYDKIVSDNGYYWGAAIQLDEPLTAGKYRFAITFSEYTISFEYTVQ